MPVPETLRSWWLPLAILLSACASRPAPSTPPPAAPAEPAEPTEAKPAEPTEAAPAEPPKHRLAVDLDEKRFKLLKRSGAETVFEEVGKERYLELYGREADPCNEDAVPEIGPVTATTAEQTEPRGTLTFHWFAQRSSVDHVPFTAAGLYVCSEPHVMVTIRFVGPETSMDGAAEALRQLLESRGIILE